jgi:hypothetical protein
VSAARLQTLLGLSDEELLMILRSDAIAVITGEEDQRPEVRILLQLLEAEETPAGLPLWVRTGSPSPLDHLLRQDFAAFEDKLTELRERGFIIRRGPGASPPATSP